jgi:hypothetical protein
VCSLIEYAKQKIKCALNFFRVSVRDRVRLACKTFSQARLFWGLVGAESIKNERISEQ